MTLYQTLINRITVPKDLLYQSHGSDALLELSSSCLLYFPFENILAICFVLYPKSCWVLQFSMPPTINRINVQGHFGSTADEVKSEPDWRVVLGERLIVYSNQLDRRPGLTLAGDTVVVEIRSGRSSNGIKKE